MTPLHDTTVILRQELQAQSPEDSGLYFVYNGEHVRNSDLHERVQQHNPSKGTFSTVLLHTLVSSVIYIVFRERVRDFRARCRGKRKSRNIQGTSR